MNIQKFNIGGVPEHFNLPWHLAIEEGKFKEKGFEVNWTDFSGGTGAMTKALRNKELDIAILLTEGAVKDVADNANYKIVQFYVETPLKWGLHVANNSDIQNVEDIKGKKYAISREGSGSHLMAYVDAMQRGFDLKDLQFEIVGNLDGARKSLPNGEADVFLWEKFTTKPFVDNGEFRRIGECPTPWPCFVIAVRDEFLHDPAWLQDFLSVINTSATSLKKSPNATQLIAERYQLKVEDVEEWFAETEWAPDHYSLYPTVLENVMEILVRLEVMKERVLVEKLFFNE